jgi:hypothetical protein
MPPRRNDPCPCGSGRKYKQCCLPREEAQAVADSGWLRMRRVEGELDRRLTEHLARHYGPGAVEEAWAAFTLWREPPASLDEWPEADSSFPSWLLYEWEPEQRERPDGVVRPAMSVAEHYAEHQGPRLDSYERRYIEAVRSEPVTFYLVKATVPG